MKNNVIRRYIIMLLCLLVCVIVIYSASGIKPFSNKSEASDYILKNHIEQTGAKNAVAAIYLNYRLFDTLFESLVLVLSAVAVIYFSWSGEDE